MSDVLDQSEVDALLNSTSDDEEKEEKEAKESPVTPLQSVAAPAEADVEAYDLTSQERIISGRMPRLESVNQKLARQLRAAISGSLRRAVDVNALKTQTMKYGDLMKNLPMPTSMHVFRMQPLQGGGLLTLETKLVFALIDSFFGGHGGTKMKIDGREFTAIESRMILRVVEIVFEEMERAWEALEDITVGLERSEVNPQFVGIASPSDVVFVTPFEVEMDEARGNITVCLPYSMLEPIRNKLEAGYQTDQAEVDSTGLRRILRQLEWLEVEVSVDIGSTEMTMEAILHLEVGDIIRLDQDRDSTLVAKVEGIPKFIGFPCRNRKRAALRITERVILPEDEEAENE